MRKVTPLAAALIVGLVAGCVVNPAVDAGPPAPVPDLRAEIRPNPPVTAEPVIWQPGHWDWNGDGYVWSPGRYVPADGHGHRWMPGWWSRTEAGWQWQPPHWMS